MSVGERFGTRFGTAMTLIGVAVGLANVWRFPYMAGQYGGGAFVAIYVAFVLLLGAPALIAEWSLGRLTRAGPGGAFTSIGMPGGRFIGGLLFLTVFMACSYYTVVVAQVLFYAALGGVVVEPEAFYARNFGGMTGLNLSLTVLVFGAMGLVAAFGVRRGVERLSRIAMPLVAIGLVVVAVRSVTLPGASEGIRYLLWPDLGSVSAETFLAALGQAFFSLSLGGTFFLAYGSYLPSNANLRRLSGTTIFGDSGAAILGGLAVLPAAFALGVEPASGPPLVFFTLPRVFAAMPGGEYVLVMTKEAGAPGMDGGIFKKSGPEDRPYNYIGVQSIDETLAKVEAAGGTVVQPKMAVPGIGWSAIAADPEGNPHGLFQDDSQAA